MFWYIILGVAVIMLIVSIVLTCVFRYSYNNDWWVGILITSFIILPIVLVMITVPLQYNKEIETFKREKAYIEDVVPTLPSTDNYAITTKRIEENKWLYEIQYRYEHYHFWNFVPAEVMELEEIK